MLVGMPTDLALKTMNAVHRVALRLTGGRLGWTAAGMPVVELTTTGRKTGQPRTVMLTSPYQEDSTWVIVASRGGDDRPPAWYLNIEADPAVEVAFQGGPRQRIRARIASADERARLWPLVTRNHDRYAGYQGRTTREIPLVLLNRQT
jgi:deazaflavin-dependent oxidoreductase (nitroreductase family)